MAEHELRAMRIQRRIQDPLDSRKIKPTVFGKGVITVDGKRDHRKDCYQRGGVKAILF